MPSAQWRFLKILWIVNLIAVAVIWGIVPLLIKREPEPGSPIRTFGIVLIAFGILEMFWILLIRRLARRRAEGARSAGELVSRVGGLLFMAEAMAMTPAILGLVLYVTTGNRGVLALMCVLSLAALVLTRPRPEEWRDILPSGGWDI